MDPNIAHSDRHHPSAMDFEADDSSKTSDESPINAPLVSQTTRSKHAIPNRTSVCSTFNSLQIPPKSVSAPPDLTDDNDTPVIVTSHESFNCPISGCTKVYKHLQDLEKHLTDHTKKSQEIPDTWLSTHQRAFCIHCKLLVSTAPGAHNWIADLNGYSHARCRKAAGVSSTPSSKPQPNRPSNSNVSLSQSTLNFAPVPPPVPTDPSVPVVRSLPSLQEILSFPCSTRRYIPASTIQLFAKALNFAINEVVTKNDVSSWTQLLALPKCCLSTIKSKLSAAQQIKAKLQDFSEGKWLRVWNSLTKESSKDFPKDWTKLVISKAEAGNLTNAFRSMNSKGVAPITPVTIDALKSLHPDNPNFRAPSTKFKSTDNLVFSQESIDKAIKSFPKGTAPGPDGLRVQHLLDVLRMVPKNSTSDIRSSLTKLVALIVSGRVNTQFASVFSSANLIPLNKDSKITNSIRPIAVGTTWRRLCGKIALSIVSEKASNYFNSYQLGVGTPFGTEIIVHTIRQVVNANKENDDFVLFQADFTNAFNNCSRPNFINLVEKEFPEILPFVCLCYCFDPKLFVSCSNVIDSQNGTQQGDPLGPLLFCASIDEFLRKLFASFPDIVNLWYMDDGIFGGPTQVISQIIKSLTADGPSQGIHLNPAKSVLFWPSDSNLNDNLFDPSFKRAKDGICLLGVPIGSDTFVENYFKIKFQKDADIIRKLPMLNDTQIAFSILHKCLGFSKVNYFLRSAPPDQTNSLSSTFDSTLFETFEAILGKDLSQISKHQARLPIKTGGLGLRSAAKHNASAFISSLNSVQDSIKALLKSNGFIEEEKSKACAHLSKQLDGKQVDEKLQHSKRQKVISESIDIVDFRSLMANSSQSSQARIHSCSGPHGSVLINAPLAPIRGFRLTSQEFSFFISTRLGLSNISSNGEKCRLCAKPMDTFGYHVANCRSGDYSVIHRHNAIRNLFFTLCQRAAYNPKLEIVCANTKVDKLTPADIFIPVGPGSQPIAVDVAVVHPQSVKIVDQASKSPDAANLAAENRKNSKYLEVCNDSSIQFKPLAIEFYGRLSPNALSFVAKLSTAIANRFGGSVSTVSRDIQTKIMITLTKISARAVLERVQNRLVA